MRFRVAPARSLAELIRKFEAARKGKSEQTKNTDRSILNALEETWPHGLTIQVAEIRPSHLEEWLAKHEARIKNTTFNRYASVLRQMFDIAVIYDEQRYNYRGKFAETRFERDCLVEYAEVFKTVCVDAAYYQFPPNISR